MALDPQIGRLNEGDVYLQEWVNDVLSPEVLGPLSGTLLGIQTESDIKQNISKARGSYGKTVDEDIAPKPTKVSLGFNRSSSKLLAIAFQGTAADNTVTGGTITDEAIIFKLDQWVAVSQSNLSAVVIATKVDGTDYEVHPRLNMIKALSTGSSTDNEALNFSATFGAIDSKQIKGGTRSKITFQIVMDGKNRIGGKDFTLRIPEITLRNDADSDQLSDDFLELKFAGEMTKRADEAAEFYHDGDIVLS